MLCLAVCRSVAAVCGRVYLRRGAAPDSDRRLPVVLCTVACTVLPSPGESRLQDLVPGVRSRERRESFFSSVLSVHLRLEAARLNWGTRHNYKWTQGEQSHNILNPNRVNVNQLLFVLELLDALNNQVIVKENKQVDNFVNLAVEDLAPNPTLCI